MSEKGVVGRRGARAARWPGRGALLGRGVGGSQQERVHGAAAAEGTPEWGRAVRAATTSLLGQVGSVPPLWGLHPGAGNLNS